MSKEDNVERFEVRGRFEPNLLCRTLEWTSVTPFMIPAGVKELAIWDKLEDVPLPFEIKPKDMLIAQSLCTKLNRLATIKENKSNKPKPLKDELIELLSDIPATQIDMANKIKRQKQHIKTLEQKIKYLKKDNQSLQRSYCKLSTDLQQITGERDYYYKEHIKRNYWE